MEMTVQSKILKGIVTKILSKIIKKNVDEDCELDIQKLKVECHDDTTTASITLSISIGTGKLPAILKKYGIL